MVIVKKVIKISWKILSPHKIICTFISYCLGKLFPLISDVRWVVRGLVGSVESFCWQMRLKRRQASSCIFKPSSCCNKQILMAVLRVSVLTYLLIKMLRAWQACTACIVTGKFMFVSLSSHPVSLKSFPQKIKKQMQQPLSER